MATPGTIAFHTLGCKLNFAESSAIKRQFEQHGYAVRSFDEGADIYVINTCSVTDFADRKCRKAVRQALKKNNEAKVVVIGCYAQLKPEEIANIEGVDLVLGAAEKFQVLSYVDQLENVPGKAWVKAGEVSQANTFVDAFSFGDRTRSFLKVQDGCDYNCSFCTIPQARGQSRSDQIDQIVRNAQHIAAQGAKEIVLTGVNIGDFGNGTAVIEGHKAKKEALFIDLLRALEKDGSVPRFRISSIEPNLCTEEIIEFVATSNHIMPHFHMPLQSGNDKQLHMMRRRYKRSLYADRVRAIKQWMPHAAIGVDVIVGFPGETDDDFTETKRFLSSLDITYLHVFTYSERANTPAIQMDGVVPMEERRSRNAQLRTLSLRKRRDFFTQHLATGRPILIEQSKEEGKLTGFTDNYIKIELSGSNDLINTIREVKLESINGDRVIGTC
ncbi:MAG: tRNA (N(6)-L-threonylcarbamoyladenosine(37)-C(2))-methylthiotransferase MtaB [Saprospiraceae bacterium]|nr:tRNA (N(6)-L-threonylcarbamoyladenosine(37)-C(2))-methylthiotransferase MtaB [Saprospiraceae bacterium]